MRVPDAVSHCPSEIRSGTLAGSRISSSRTRSTVELAGPDSSVSSSATRRRAAYSRNVSSEAASKTTPRTRTDSVPRTSAAASVARSISAASTACTSATYASAALPGARVGRPESRSRTTPKRPRAITP